MRFTNIISTLLLFMVSNLAAEQMEFSKIANKDGYRFSYLWQDHAQQRQALSFTFSNEVLFSKFRHFKTYKNSSAEQYVNNMLKRELTSNPIQGVQVIFQPFNNQLELRGKSNEKLNQATAKINALEQKFAQEYLIKNYYHTFVNHHQITLVKPDHIRFIDHSVDDFKPLKSMILEKFELQNIRHITNYILSFSQSIPYSTLMSRATSAGAGFSPPMTLLWENKGDCDSKVTLTASILRALMPRIKLILVFIDNHALLGIDSAELVLTNNESTLMHNGVRYLLAEPTGPAKLPLGQIDLNSEQAVLQGQYSVEQVN